MKLNKTEQRRIAVARLKQMGICDDYIQCFKGKEHLVTFFEDHGFMCVGYWATGWNGYQALEDKIHEIE